MTALELDHQSNGRADPLSRSWNRAILNFGLDRQNWSLNVRPWFRIDESDSEDNNPEADHGLAWITASSSPWPSLTRS